MADHIDRDDRITRVEHVERGGGNALYFIVGGLVVIAGIFLFLYANGHIGGANDVSVNVTPPAATAPAADAPAPTAPAPAPAPAN